MACRTKNIPPFIVIKSAVKNAYLDPSSSLVNVHFFMHAPRNCEKSMDHCALPAPESMITNEDDKQNLPSEWLLFDPVIRVVE